MILYSINERILGVIHRAGWNGLMLVADLCQTVEERALMMFVLAVIA